MPSPHDYELSSVLHDAAHEFFHLDGKLVRSLIALFTKPGLLAREYFEGRRSRYVRPLSLFVFVNLVFFVVQPHTGLLKYGFDEFVAPRNDGRLMTKQRQLVEAKLAATGEDREVYRARFNALLQGKKKSFLIFVVPVFALALKLLYLPRRRRYVEHLVFAIHLYAVYLVSLLVVVFVAIRLILWPIAGAAVRAKWLPRGVMNTLDSEEFLVVLLLCTLGSYLYLALRRFYGDGPPSALVRTLLLFGAHVILMISFPVALFFSTYAST